MKNLKLFIKNKKIELFRKFVHKFFSKNYTLKKKDYFNWLNVNSKDLSQICKSVDSNLWKKAIDFQNNVILKKKNICKKSVDKVYICRGGTEFLYFVTLLKKPEVIVETGVGLGFSSLAFLSGINENKRGILYSSDLPYVKYKNSENKIGYVVDKELKKNWKLYINGDLTNLKHITKFFNKIDIFHYDSDKTYSGVSKTFNYLKKYFNDDAILVFDDLLDHTFFYDLVNSNNYKYWGIYKYKNTGFIGFIGNLTKKYKI